jgi:hypothetical protein
MTRPPPWCGARKRDRFLRGSFSWIKEKRLAIIANSDAHAPVRTDYPPRTRPVTLLFSTAPTLEGVREALSARRTAAWQAETVWGPEEYLAPLWRAAVTVEPGRCIVGGPASHRTSSPEPPRFRSASRPGKPHLGSVRAARISAPKAPPRCNWGLAAMRRPAFRASSSNLR